MRIMEGKIVTGMFYILQCDSQSKVLRIYKITYLIHKYASMYGFGHHIQINSFI